MTTFTSLTVENFVGFHQRLEWRDHASLNVIIGVNDTGKTHLLKLLYAMTRSIEDYSKKQAGPEPKELAELLSSKLRWTFLPQKWNWDDWSHAVQETVLALICDGTAMVG